MRFTGKPISNNDLKPSYIDLIETGELRSRAAGLAKMYENCMVCPRNCGIDRTAGELGGCFSRSLAAVDCFTAHHGEEPPISGLRGSGTIFFLNCNLRCVYCQNFQISHARREAWSREVSEARLAEMMLSLQSNGCHNINFVSPTHFVPSIVGALCIAAEKGLAIPLVYNTNAYDSLEVLRSLDGVVDVYMPDLKYADARAGNRLSKVHGYPQAARAAIKEMFCQVGPLSLDDEGVARRGLLVRHLVLPGNLAGSVESLRWLRDEVSREVSVSVMAQYYPAHKAGEMAPLNRKVSLDEYVKVTEAVEELELHRGWVQCHAEAPDAYRPDFDRDEPFEH